MLFKKKKKRGLIDIGALQRKGKIKSEKEVLDNLNTDKEGFVDFSSSAEKKFNNGNVSSDFLEVNSINESIGSKEDVYSKKEVDSKIQEIDNIIYKLEQRIELLEKKAGVNNSGSVIGW